MSFEEFYEKFKEFIATTFDGATCQERDVLKVNRIEKSVTVNIWNLSPSFCIDSEYEVYLKMNDKTMYFKRLENIIKKAIEDSKHIVESDFSTEKMRENITFQLINYEKNKKLLKDVPHKRYLDLAIIYRVITRWDKHGNSSFIVTNKNIELLDMNMESLFFSAARNMKDKVVVENVGDFLANNEYPDIAEKQGVNTMYALSFKGKMNGAGAICYEEHLHDIANKHNTDLILIPSSIHEFLIVPYDVYGVDPARDTLRYMNRNDLSESEFLSDNVYIYNRVTRKTTIAEV